ncbi:PH domain-containing protein [Patescibacteria group bacterium]|nr:PH domain-containing protein [Patescibacteria group bacterium]MBU1867927.1 PH domain-containing protein [Patescibacteria group bacterium]
MQIAQSKTREQYPLSFKKIIKKTIASTIVVTILLLIIWGILVFMLGSTGQAAIAWLGTATLGISGFLFVTILLTYFYQRWYFAVYFYELSSDFIQIKKGPITPREITIPYERVQDIYVDQDLLDRIFGLYDVHLSSATISSGIEAHIDGVEKEAAEGLRDVLLQTVQQKISKNKSADVPASNSPIS